MRPIYLSILQTVGLAPSHKIEHGSSASLKIHILNWDTNLLNFQLISHIFLSCEKFSQPSINLRSRHVLFGIGVFSLLVKIIPELKVSVSFESFNKLVEHRL